MKESITLEEIAGVLDLKSDEFKRLDRKKILDENRIYVEMLLEEYEKAPQDEITKQHAKQAIKNVALFGYDVSKFVMKYLTIEESEKNAIRKI